MSAQMRADQTEESEPHAAVQFVRELVSEVHQDLRGFDFDENSFAPLEHESEEKLVHAPLDADEVKSVLFGGDWDDALIDFDLEDAMGELVMDESTSFGLDELMNLEDLLPEFFTNETRDLAATRMPYVPPPVPAPASTSTDFGPDMFTRYQRSAGVVSLMIDSSDGLIYAHDAQRAHIVGRACNEARFAKCTIKDEDYVHLACVYNEEVKYKGAGLGFSVFLHSLASLIIAKNFSDSILETPDGSDVETSVGTFEITGRRMLERETYSDYVIDKYALTSLLCEGEDYDEFFRLSWMEDSGDYRMFDDYALSQPDSPYTPLANQLFDCSKHTQRSHYQFLSKCVQYWLVNKDWIIAQDGKVAWQVASDLCTQLALRFNGYNPISGEKASGRAPVPYRVLPRAAKIPVLQEEMMSAVITPGMVKGWSSYKTQKSDYDPELLLSRKCANPIIMPEIHNRIVRMFTEQIMVYECMQATYAESVLMTKITGKQGTFYDPYCQLGVAWRKKEGSAVNGYACFFMASAQPDMDLVGKWSEYTLEEIFPSGVPPLLHHKTSCISVSPAFSFNNNDIHYASALWGKIITQVIVSMSQVAPTMRSELLPRLISYTNVFRNSSWMTTSLASECRFFTLTEMAGSGDPASMVISCCAKLASLPNNKIAFPTYYYYDKLRRYAASPRAGGRQRTTPLWRFPGNLLCLEKDIALAMQWKVRLNDDKGLCTQKVLDGIVAEQEERDSVLAHLEIQVGFMRGLLNGTATVLDFMTVMTTSPKIPHYNHPFFAGLTYDVAQPLKASAGERRESTDLRLSGLCTDHNAWTFNTQGFIMKYRVADGVNKLLRYLDGPQCVHQAIVRMKTKPKFRNIYPLHPKGNKQSRREIAQQNENMRLFQYTAETLASVYTDAAPVDMMRDPQKYAKVVQETVKIVRQGGFIRSEDRSFFCGHMQPEFMAIALYHLSRVTASTTLVCASSILRQNRSRWVVMPADSSNVKIPPGAVSEFVMVQNGKSVNKHIMLQVYKHKMQGMGALSAAAINTSFNDGFNNMLRVTFPQITEAFAATTSDDVIRGYVVNEDRRSDIAQYIYKIPSQSCTEVMMKDSITKPMELSGGGEFNNIAIASHGAVTQSPIHSVLAIQPLTAPSIIADVIAAVSQARSTLTWGDSPDLCQSALEMYKVMLQARWLLPEDFFDLMATCGLWPTSLEELIGGFSPRDDLAYSIMWNACSDENKERVLSGEAELTVGLMSWRHNAKTEKKKVTDCTLLGAPYTVNHKLSQIVQSRRNKGKMNPTFIPQLAVKRRREMSSGFIRHIQKCMTTPIEQGILLSLKQMNPIAKVTVHPTPMRKRLLMPTKMGEGYFRRPEHSKSVINALRHVGVTVGRQPRDSERLIVSMDHDEYKRWLIVSERTDRMCGLKFDSPMGLPIMMFHNTTVFKKGVLFNFSVTSSYEIDIHLQSVHIAGRTYHGVKPPEWGGKTLKKCKDERWRLGFGVRTIDGEVTMLIRTGFDYAAVTAMPLAGWKMCTALYNGYTYAMTLEPDFTPLDPSKYLERYEPCGLITYMTGTDTALLNYGKYINTSSDTPFRIMTRIYATFDSHLPRVAKTLLRPNWIFPSSAVVLPLAEYTILIGSRSICRLKLERQDGAVCPRATINLESATPILIDDSNELFDDVE